MWDFSDGVAELSKSNAVGSNLLLRQLSIPDRTSIEHHLQFETVSPGTTLVEIGEPLDALYFPLQAVISLEEAAGMEVAAVGREGMFGWTAFAEYNCSPFRAVARGPESLMLKLPTVIANAALAASANLRAMVYQYLVVVSIHMSETIGSQGSHRVDARLARWLLVRHDRLRGDEIRVHHAEIAENLGVRRASITDCLHILEGELLIRCRRGRIIIRDRLRLEQMAGRCYGSAEAHYRSAFGSFGKRACETMAPVANQMLTMPRPAETLRAM